MGSNNKQWTTWFSSDQHYGHESVIGFCNRPFNNAEEMNQALIDNWNTLVKPEDLCIFVGDVFMYCNAEKMRDILSKLNGNRKILVIGNHDRDRRNLMNVGFSLVVEQMVLEIAEEKVLLSHYPFRMKPWLSFWVKTKARIKNIFRWFGIETKPIFFEKYHNRRPKDEGQFLICGHTHTKYKSNGRMIDVGVDSRKYKPVNIQVISNEISEIKRKGPVWRKYNSYKLKED